MKRIWLSIVLVSVLLTGLNAQTKHIVMVSNFVFTPQDLNVTVGDTVEWQWVEGTHTTTSDSTAGIDVWDSPISSSVPVFSVVIRTPGVHNYHCTPHQSLGMIGSITATMPTEIKVADQLPFKFTLSQNFPNPFNPSTMIMYNLKSPAYVSLKVYNTLGNEVAVLVNGYQNSGEHMAVFDITKTQSLASGIYFYRLKAGGLEQTRKMMLIK
jgi:plastocyanin